MPEQTTLQTEVTEAPDRRDMLTEAFEAAEKAPEPAQPTEAEQRARDDAGRFAPKQEQPAPTPAPEPVAEAPKLTTWKKEYLPLHEKLARGEALTPDEAKKLAQYNGQRESEYSTGVSVFKERATRLESIEKAITPFMPELQKNNIPPDQWIANLGRAHHTLALGTPEQKLQMFQKLAQDYGIPLGAVQQAQSGQVDPALMGLMEQFQQLRGQVQEVTGWREQQQQQAVSQAIAEIANDAENYPHFEKVRGTMAELLQSGLAPDLKTAYTKAVRMDDEVWQEEQSRQSQLRQSAVTQRQAVAKAKATATPRSVTPSAVSGNSGAKDRRSLIAEQLDAVGGRV